MARLNPPPAAKKRHFYTDEKEKKLAPSQARPRIERATEKGRTISG